MRYLKIFVALLLLFILLSACLAAPIPDQGSTSSAPLSETSSRSILTYSDLITGFNPLGILGEAAVTIPEDATPSPHTFEGYLELLDESTNGEAEVYSGSFPEKYKHLPEFNFAFVKWKDYLIPVQRGLIISNASTYNFILEPGRIWQESEDQSWSRASLPFSLVFKGNNSMLSGTLTFLFNGQTVSKAWYQITQEVTTNTKADLWGLLDAEYHAASLPNADNVRQSFQAELANRFPTQPISDLAGLYPDIDLSAFGSGVPPQHMAWYGVIVDGVNYLGGCQTRAGTYPYCEWMRQPSYSVAKSTFPALALMRLTQVFGAQVPNLLIKDYLPEVVSGKGNWDTVTFNNALDMATGNYGSTGFMIDDNSDKMMEFFIAQPYAARMQAALDWPELAPPGTRWVYRTSDTFILTRAMQNYLRTQTGGEDDIFQYVVDEIYAPLGLGPGAFTTMRSADDDWHGQAEGGYGLWWIPDDIAKLTTFLLLEQGQIGGEQILDPGLLAASLQQDPADRGMSIGPVNTYNNAFWAQRFGPEQGYTCEFWVVEWQGISGNMVALFPNGIVYYYFSDSGEFTINQALSAANQMHPFCP
ncbi:MAG: beta-lactamase family protein [Anaerolineaceae bacterium]|nr:beta-lactamase family protein [Anaerolineaceae bacterium]